MAAVHPIERLRFVARAGDADPSLLAAEAAVAFAGLAHDPRALVTSAKRLVEFHPGCAPLWWVAARVLGAVDAAEAARESVAMLDDDPTCDELAAALPGGAAVVCGPSPLVVAAVATRPDLTVRVVGAASFAEGLRALAGREVTGWSAGEARAAVSGARVAVVEALAACPGGCVLDGPSAAVAREARDCGVPVWIAAGVGRVLPGVLFDALVRRSPGSCVLGTDTFDGVAGPHGWRGPAEGLDRGDCPAPPELAR